MVPLEILLGLIGIALLCAIIWTVFDHRDLRAKYNGDRDDVIEALGKLRADVDKLKQRA